uniref:Uncharacterized protein n=1 Tax=Helianthus annuus TaxID=4232 RepID=A0A251SQ02_HELAN
MYQKLQRHTAASKLASPKKMLQQGSVGGVPSCTLPRKLFSTPAHAPNWNPFLGQVA